MLERGTYPSHLKKRIRGGMGHLSNKQALQLFISHRPAFMSHLFLSHLSANNNKPELVSELFNGHAGNIKMVLASRYQETPVYHIEDFSIPAQKRLRQHVSLQLSFSFA
jgi:hypothetical protein